MNVEKILFDNLKSIIQISIADLVYCDDELHQLASDESLSLVSSTFLKIIKSRTD